MLCDTVQVDNREPYVLRQILVAYPSEVLWFITKIEHFDLGDSEITLQNLEGMSHILTGQDFARHVRAGNLK